MAFAKQCAFLEVATSKIQFQEFNELKLKIHRVSYKLCSICRYENALCCFHEHQWDGLVRGEACIILTCIVL